jgi:hypothetical protein
MDITEIKALLPKQPQRQDSTLDQVSDLLELAHHLGMYDAADLIMRRQGYMGVKGNTGSNGTHGDTGVRGDFGRRTHVPYTAAGIPDPTPRWPHSAKRLLMDDVKLLMDDVNKTKRVQEMIAIGSGKKSAWTSIWESIKKNTRDL